MELIQVVKFKEPKEYRGFPGFTSYGYVQLGNKEIVHIKNPDFGWKYARRHKREDWSHLSKK